MLDKNIKLIPYNSTHTILLDVNSGSIHLLDQIGLDVLLKYVENKLPEKLTIEEQEALNTLLELKEKGQLFTEDNQQLPKQMNQSLKSLCLNVAHTCNLACPYCFASGGNYQGTEGLMTQEVGEKAIDFLLTNSTDRKIVEVDFFGGEPLLNFPLIKHLVAYGKEKGKEQGKIIKWSMTTNGVLLDDEKQDFLVKESIGTVLSIDGREEVHDRHRYFKNKKGSHAIILKNLQSFKEKTQDYVVRGTFTGYNKDFPLDVQALKDYGFRHISMEPVITQGSEPWDLQIKDLKVLEKSYEDLKNLYIEWYNNNDSIDFFHFNISLAGGPCLYKRLTACGAGFEYVAITPTGDIYPCHQLIEDEAFKMGNILEGSWNQEIAETFSNISIYTKESCKTCWARFYCSGGCHANNIHCTNSLEKPYTLGCELEKIRLEKAIEVQVYQLLHPKSSLKGNDRITQEKIINYVKE